ncbi:MAG TPA: hypothetical protein VI685_08280 [Candidatus Angelobacter sp.]
MKKLAIILFATASLAAFAADTTIKGYLVDISCAMEEGQRPDFGIKHSKKCLQMPDCAASGYGVLTDDKKVIFFDKAGSEKATKFIDSITKSNDIKVVVTGTLDGDHMVVNKIELQ